MNATRTLQPDFGGPEDTSKFQFLGHVLGTARPTRFPLYVMLSHVFVQLPVGSIAYRANHFSAFMAAIACAMAYVVARQLGARRWYSACAAIGRRFARGVYFSGRNAGAAAPVDARRSERVLDRTIG